MNRGQEITPGKRMRRLPFFALHRQPCHPAVPANGSARPWITSLEPVQEPRASLPCASPSALWHVVAGEWPAGLRRWSWRPPIPAGARRATIPSRRNREVTSASVATGSGRPAASGRMRWERESVRGGWSCLDPRAESIRLGGDLPNPTDSAAFAAVGADQVLRAGRTWFPERNRPLQLATSVWVHTDSSSPYVRWAIVSQPQRDCPTNLGRRRMASADRGKGVSSRLPNLGFHRHGAGGEHGNVNCLLLQSRSAGVDTPGSWTVYGHRVAGCGALEEELVRKRIEEPFDS